MVRSPLPWRTYQYDYRSRARLLPGLYFTADPLVAVLHALFDHRPDLRVAALPFGDCLVPEVRQVRHANLAGEETADREVAEAGEEGGPAAVLRGGTGGPGDAVQNLLLLGRRGGGEILLKEARRLQIQPGDPAEHSGGEVPVAVLARAEVEPIVDELGDAGGGGAAGVLVGGDDEIAEHLHGPPLVGVENLALVRLLRGRGRGRRGVGVFGLCLRGRGGGCKAQDVDEIAAGDVHVLLLRDWLLKIPFPDLVGDVVAGAPAQRRDGERRVLVGVAGEGRGVGDEQILAVPRLAPLRSEE